jgi:MurNAc alpha-1-phosphate uridylyltransferase
MTKPISRAMILAAGFGRRLRPLTSFRPKPLLPILNQPLLFLWLETLRAIGVKRVVINAHHLADQIELALREKRRDFDDLDIFLSLETTILGTAGGLKKALPLIFPDSPNTRGLGPVTPRPPEYPRSTGSPDPP